MDDLAEYEPWLGVRPQENTFNGVPDSFLPHYVVLEGESAAEVCSLWRKTKLRWQEAVIGVGVRCHSLSRALRSNLRKLVSRESTSLLTRWDG
jgi:hypothetical protein